MEKWIEIGGHYYGAPGERTRSSPQFALQLASIYQHHLSQFDQAYLNTVIHKKAQGMNLGMQGQAGGAPGGANMGGMGQQQQQQQPPPHGTGAMAGASLLTGAADPAELQQFLQFARHSADDLRRMGVNQETINKVELHRDLLLRTLEGQRSFQEGVRRSMAQGNPNMGMPGQANQLLQGGPQGGAQGNMQNMPMVRVPSAGVPDRPLTGTPQQGMFHQVYNLTDGRRPTAEDQQRAMQLLTLLRDEVKGSLGE